MSTRTVHVPSFAGAPWEGRSPEESDIEVIRACERGALVGHISGHAGLSGKEARESVERLVEMGLLARNEVGTEEFYFATSKARIYEVMFANMMDYLTPRGHSFPVA